MGNEEPKMLAALNGLLFGFLSSLYVFSGHFAFPFAVFAGLSALFWISAWLAGRNEIRPLIAAFVLTLGAFIWSESMGFMEGGVIYLLIFAYLSIGVVVSVILHRETRARLGRRRPKTKLLERGHRR